LKKYRSDRIRPAITGVRFESLPECPEHIQNKSAIDLWNDVVFDLNERGRLSTVGIHIVRQYVESFAIYDNVSRQIFKGEDAVSKNTYDTRKNPIYSIRSKALEEMGKLEKLLGLSPYSRDRITVAEPEDESDPIDF
jgi:P27 family predicted phage terminase small subunit